MKRLSAQDKKKLMELVEADQPLPPAWKSNRKNQGAKPVPDTKTSLFTRILPELKEKSPYFNLSAVKQRLNELQMAVKDNSLRQYMHKAMAQDVVHDAGRGWYARVSEPVELEREAVHKLVKLLAKEFPLLDFSVWSTQQVNPWMHHLLGKYVDFVMVDPDGMESVWAFLREKHYDAHLNPTGVNARRFSPLNNTVVIRRLLTEAPRDNHFSPPEAVLVDLFVEREALGLMDLSEFQSMASAMATSGRLMIGALLDYAERRKVTDARQMFDQPELIVGAY